MASESNNTPELTDEALKKRLSAQQYRVLRQRETERPGTSHLDDKRGVYRCVACDTALFASTQFFNAGCGWPAAEDDLGTVKRVPDADGRRVEIVCATCDAAGMVGHLGHVFTGERFTATNTRHCVNGVVIKLDTSVDPDEAVKAAKAAKAAKKE